MSEPNLESTKNTDGQNTSPTKPTTTKKRNISPSQSSPLDDSHQEEKYILVKITQREFDVMLHLVEEYEKQKEKKREYYRRKTEDCKPNGLYKPMGVKYKIFEL
jgi:hypothetical protein